MKAAFIFMSFGTTTEPQDDETDSDGVRESQYRQ